MKNLPFKLPGSWKIESLPKLLFFQEGPGVRNWQFKENGVKLLNVGNINNGKLNLDATSIYLSEEEAYGKYAHFLVDAGDLVIASSGIVVNNFHNKITFVESKHLPLCMNTSTIRFKTLDKNILDIQYFRVFLGTNIFKNQLKKLITGTAQLNFGPSHLKKISIPLPQINDQICIATLLSRVEALIAIRKDNLRLLDEFLKSTFLEMFGDPVRNDKNWKFTEIQNVCIEIVDCVNKTAPKVDDEETPYLMLRTSNIKNGRISLKNVKYVSKETFEIWTRRSIPQKGDILLTREAPMGEVAIIDFEQSIFLGQRIVQYRVKFDEIAPLYLLHLMRTRFFEIQIEKLGKGSTVKHLSVPDCFKFSIPVPSIAIQNQFAAIVEKAESLKNHYQQNLTELENLYGALSQKAFKGELDLSRIPLTPKNQMEAAP